MRRVYAVGALCSLPYFALRVRQQEPEVVRVPEWNERTRHDLMATAALIVLWPLTWPADVWRPHLLHRAAHAPLIMSTAQRVLSPLVVNDTPASQDNE